MECVVELVPADASPTWVSAEHDVETRVRQDATDCARITIEVGEKGAVILFTTRDGRQARREVASPAQLGASIDALLITTELAAPLHTDEPEAAPPPPPAPVHLLASVLVGGRLSAPSAFVSPAVVVRAGVAIDGWEIGLWGQAEPVLQWLDGIAPAGYSVWRYAVGASFARRQAIGSTLVIVLGGDVAVTVVGPGADSDDPPQAQPALGAFFGLVLPQRSRIRLRAEIGGEVGLTGTPPSDDQGYPTLPWVSAGVSLGVEGELL
jgi:hypothetical protein